MNQIKDHLMLGEEIRQYDDIYVTQYRIIQESDSFLRKDFHDLLFRDLESIEYGDRLNTPFSVISLIFFIFGVFENITGYFVKLPYLSEYVDPLSLYILAGFFLLSS